MMNEIYIALGSAFFGSFMMAVYARISANGTSSKLARLEERIIFLEKEIEELKEILRRECKLGVVG